MGFKRRWFFGSTATVVSTAGLVLALHAQRPSSYGDAICIATASSAVKMFVKLASTNAERKRGLMGREHLPEDAGMLFRYPAERPADAGFWMYRTLIPLDIAFLDGRGQILAIRQMQPCIHRESRLCPRYEAGAPHWAALEANRGFFETHGVRVGDYVREANLAGCSPK